jgi:hypothetical protein
VKVIGTGSPTKLVIRLAPAEQAAFAQELVARRDAAARAMAIDELAAVQRVLDQIDAPDAPRERLTISGPTPLLHDIVREAARSATDDLRTLVAQLDTRAATDVVPQLQAAAGAAQACVSTLIACEQVTDPRLVP